MSWLERAEARQQVKVDRQNALHRGFHEHQTELWFRATDGQRQRSVLALVTFTLATAVAGLAIDRPQVVYSVLVLSGFVALAALASVIVVVRDFTHFSPTGIQSRHWGRWRELSWADVASIGVEEIKGRGYLIRLTADLRDGRRVRLGAPWSGSGGDDPDFSEKLERILIYCRVQAAEHGTGDGAATSLAATDQSRQGDLHR